VTKPRVATVWLDGCSGCHMSLIDLDERILDIFSRADLVYGPLVDFKEFPGRVHFTVAQKGWEEVADYVLDWLSGKGL
jgi:NAD-reducing hydrogenase small subunit